MSYSQTKSRITEMKLQNKIVFLRDDLNVPLDKGNIENDFKLQKSLPTIDYILDHKGTIVLATHLGRPKNKDPELSTKQLIPWFKERGYTIYFIKDITSNTSSKIIPHQKTIYLLENLRFFPGEKDQSKTFAKILASLADIYINDAFGTLHRKDASVALVPEFFTPDKKTFGFLIEKELKMLHPLVKNIKKPFICFIGGKKISDKLSYAFKLMETVQELAICPALVFTLLKEKGLQVGKSLIDESAKSAAKEIIEKSSKSKVDLILPQDYLVSENNIKGKLFYCKPDQFKKNYIGISIGPETVKILKKKIDSAETIFFNAPMGFSSRKETLNETYELLNYIAESKAYTVVGGGTSVQLALNTQPKAFNHLSTGGGATLAYISNSPMPGLKALIE